MNSQSLYKKGTLFWRPSLLNLGYSAVGLLFYKTKNMTGMKKRAFDERIDKRSNSALSRPSFAAVYRQEHCLRGGILTLFPMGGLIAENFAAFPLSGEKL